MNKTIEEIKKEFEINRSSSVVLKRREVKGWLIPECDAEEIWNFIETKLQKEREEAYGKGAYGFFQWCISNYDAEELMSDEFLNRFAIYYETYLSQTKGGKDE